MTTPMLIALIKDHHGQLVCIAEPSAEEKGMAPILIEILITVENTLEITCGKNRYGATGSLRLPTRISTIPPAKD